MKFLQFSYLQKFLPQFFSKLVNHTKINFSLIENFGWTVKYWRNILKVNL